MGIVELRAALVNELPWIWPLNCTRSRRPIPWSYSTQVWQRFVLGPRPNAGTLPITVLKLQNNSSPRNQQGFVSAALLVPFFVSGTSLDQVRESELRSAKVRCSCAMNSHSNSGLPFGMANSSLLRQQVLAERWIAACSINPSGQGGRPSAQAVLSASSLPEEYDNEKYFCYDHRGD